jgi:hypothetical protein
MLVLLVLFIATKKLGCAAYRLISGVAVYVVARDEFRFGLERRLGGGPRTVRFGAKRQRIFQLVEICGLREPPSRSRATNSNMA